MELKILSFSLSLLPRAQLNSVSYNLVGHVIINSCIQISLLNATVRFLLSRSKRIVEAPTIEVTTTTPLFQPFLFRNVGKLNGGEKMNRLFEIAFHERGETRAVFAKFLFIPVLVNIRKINTIKSRAKICHMGSSLTD